MYSVSDHDSLNWLNRFRKDNEKFTLKEMYEMRNFPSLSNVVYDDNGLALASNLKSLESIGLTNEVTDKGFKKIEKLKNLKKLSIWATSITDKGFQSINKLSNLEVLILQQTKLSNDASKHLAGLKKLKILFIIEIEQKSPFVSKAKIGNPALAYLKDIKSLKELYIVSHLIDNKGLIHLTEMKQLKKLVLNSFLTKEGKETLEKALPNCEIKYNQSMGFNWFIQIFLVQIHIYFRLQSKILLKEFPFLQTKS